MRAQSQGGLFRVRLGEPDVAVDLSLLENLAEHLRGAFREIVREQTGEGRVQVRLLVRDASKGSLVLTVEPELTGEDVPLPGDVARTLIDDINGLAADTPRPTIGSNLLAQYRALVEVGQKAGRLELGFEDASTFVGPENQVTFDAAMREQPEPDIRVVGHIESVSIHRRPWTFGLYTKFDQQRVDCRFQDDMLDKVLRVMEAKALAEVVGEGRFAQVGMTPRQIELTEPPTAISFDAAELLSYRHSAEISKAGESAADALLRVREERAGFG